MSRELTAFLNWFEGYSENIEGAPTVAQWERAKTKIQDLRRAVEIAGDEPMIAVHLPQAPAEPQKPKTSAQWTARAKAFLIEAGFDPESADEVMANVAVDMGRDPEAVAREAAGPALSM